MGVELEVLIVRRVEQVGRQLEEPKNAVVPAGNPEREKVTGDAVPEVKVAVMVLVTDEPWVTETLPELERVKSNIGGVNVLR